MPVKQRASARRIDLDVELKAWRITFKSSFDFLRSLPRVGVEISGRHQLDRDVAEEAWHRLGEQYLASCDLDAPMCWAEREFGPPTSEPARRRPGGARRRR